MCLNSPCSRCTRVPEPACCDDRRCLLWRQWFVSAWEQRRRQLRRQMDSISTTPLGVPLGGNHYAPPHLIRRYRSTDPCAACGLKGFCEKECNVRILWKEQGGIQ